MTDKQHSFPTYDKVFLPTIDTTDIYYSICPRSNEPSIELIQHIQNFGILHPPLVQKKSNGTFSVVSGKKRIFAAQKNCLPEPITCLILPENTAPVTIFNFLLQHALIGKPLSIVEQALFFQKSLQKITKNESLQFLKILGYKTQLHQIDRILKILSFEPSLLLHLHDEIINHKALRTIEKLSFADQKELGNLITHLQLGGSKQQKLAELCYELMMRKNTSFIEIVGEWRYQIKKTDEENIPQLTNSLFQWLYQQCYPKSKKAETDFNQFIAGLELTGTVHVQHTQSFENDAVSMSIVFKDRKELQTAWEKIRNILT